MSLKGKTLFISGGSRGIGLAIATAFRDAGASLACNGRWKDAKLDKDVYHDRIEKADARYARMLTLLATAVEIVLDGPPDRGPRVASLQGTGGRR